MQTVRAPLARSKPVLAGLAVISWVAFGVGLSGALGEDSGYVTFGGLVGGSFCGLLWIGFFAISRRLNKQLAAMRAGDIMGSWEVTSTDGGSPQPVDVGAEIAIVGGKIQVFSGTHQRTAGVELRQSARRLVVHAISNNGYGDHAFKVELPFDEKDVEVARACGQRLSQRQSVEFTATP